MFDENVTDRVIDNNCIVHNEQLFFKPLYVSLIYSAIKSSDIIRLYILTKDMSFYLMFPEPTPTRKTLLHLSMRLSTRYATSLS